MSGPAPDATGDQAGAAWVVTSSAGGPGTIADLLDQRDSAQEALAVIAIRAKVNAIAAHALGRTEYERQWLDVLAVIERVSS